VDDARRIGGARFLCRLLALLAARSRDVAAAEDALSEAFVSALRTWPEKGVPDNPDAWLMTAARNSMTNRFRHEGVRDRAAAELERHYQALGDAARDFPDERLKLMFVCAHPAIDAAVRTPLMMQTVLGLDAARIASAFLIPPTTMGQRLVRAKAKIRDAGIRFAVPEAHDMPARLGDVLDAIYAAFGQAWDALPGGDEGMADLTAEALFLARLLVELLPQAPEAKGLLALMLYCDARRKARRSPEGHFVPLDEQDPVLWDRALIVEAEYMLTEAAKAATFGRYQTEAAIQSVHIQRGVTGTTNHAALQSLYGLLIARQPSLGATIGYAGVLLKRERAAEALEWLDGIAADSIDNYQPYWVVRSHCLLAMGRGEEARRATDVAIGLTQDAAVRDFLLRTLVGRLRD
jgi:RNA polymerase sigma-70 factor, ECF subfamily